MSGARRVGRQLAVGIGIGWLVAASVGCSDGKETTPRGASLSDAGAVSDGGARQMFDSGAPSSEDAGGEALQPLGIGDPCPTGECPNGLTCINRAVNIEFPVDGYCSVLDCEEDSDCGAGAFCTDPVWFFSPERVGEDRRLCVKRCDASEGCARADRKCTYIWRHREDSRMRGSETACIPGKPDATDHDPCWSVADCGENGVCVGFLNVNPFILPGGSCFQRNCDPESESPCRDPRSVCRSPGIYADNLCIRTCNSDDDCRKDEGWECLPDVFGEGRNYCAVRDVAGDPCAGPEDCGPEAIDWRCLKAPEHQQFPGGYCTGSYVDDGGGCGSTSECPVTMGCYVPQLTGDGEAEFGIAPYCAGYCVDDTDCRTDEGYGCSLLNDPEWPEDRGCVYVPQAE